jgi:isopropylmalate/homocitrate/citramalate synthase
LLISLGAKKDSLPTEIEKERKENKMGQEGLGESPWKVPGKWSVSPYAFEPEVRAGWQSPEKVIVHDVTLRDGEQTPGVVFRKEEKIRIAHALEDAGIPRIEAGMVATSPEDFDAIASIAKEIKRSEISCFCRARQDDLDLALKAGVQRAVMEITALDPTINRIWGSRGKAAEDIVGLVRQAKKNGLKVTFFLMESARTPLDLIRDLIVPVVEEGKADCVAIVDTRGSAYPPGLAWQIAQVKKMVKVPIEVHCHNNWGFATASTLAGVSAGAEVVHTCINGMGANAPLDEVILGTEAFLRASTGVKTEGFKQMSDMVREFSRMNWFKPFMSPEIAQVEVGIGTRMLWDHRNEPGYGRAEFLNYDIIGGKTAEIVLGKKSGRYSIMFKAWELDLTQPTDAQATEMLTQIKTIGEDNKRLVTEEEFKKIYNDVMGTKV